MKKIRYFIPILIVLLIVVCRILAINLSLGSVSSGATVPAHPNSLGQIAPSPLSDLDQLEAFLDGVMAVQLETYHIAGATVAVVQDDQVLLKKGYGYADLQAGIPVDPVLTLFRIGSISKLFTWTAVMQLAEQGILDLDTDINTYLDFQIPETFPEPITLKNLMTHTPGFEEMGFGMFAANLNAMTSNEAWLKSHIPARIWQPGLLSAYSNYGTALAGYIVERQSGMPYERYIQLNILDPLKMNSSTAIQPLPDELALNMSQGYAFAGGDFIVKDFELINAAPAGSISATAADMARFMIAQLNLGSYGDARILQDETARTMQSRLWSADDRLNGWAYGFYEMNQNGHRIIGHGGDTRLFHSILALLPAENVGLFVSYNTETNSMAPQNLLKLFMDRYFPDKPAELTAPLADTATHAANVAGSYRINRNVFTRAGKIDSLLQPLLIQAAKDGSLTIPTPMGTMRFVEVAPYFYQQIGGDDKAVFWLNQEGEVTYTFLNSFPMMAAERLPWYEAAIFHLALGILSLLLSLSIVFMAPIGYFIHCTQSGDSRLPVLARFARWVLGSAALLSLAFVAMYAFSLNDPTLRLTGQRGLLDALSWVALFILILTTAALSLVVLAWRRKYWSRLGRIHYTLVTVSLSIFSILLIYYNQVGWQW